MSRQPIYAYAIALLLGLVAAAAPANLPLESPSFATAIVISAAVFGVMGLLLGTLWPRGTWSWGLWVVAPGLLLVTIGLISSGDLGRFLGDDLPFLASGLVTASLGGLTGARLRKPSTSVSEDRN